ncbi:MAG: apolipoprotein N-acyltransferase [Fibrobacter sp.]|nr:apolipoprotein N-acyltransferase [Fibrobacter sp.]
MFKKHPLKISIALQSLIFVLFQFRTPEIRLDFFAPEFLYLLAWMPFLRAQKPWKSWYKPFLLSLIIPQFIFMLLHYQIHAAYLSVVSLILWFVPLAIWGLVVFARWNFRMVQEREAWLALLSATIAWVLFAFTYPPMVLGPGALVFLVPWIIMLHRSSKDHALFATFWSAIIFHWVMYFWIINVAKVGPPLIIIAGVFLLMAYFSFFYVVGAWFYLQLRQRRFKKIPALVLFPFLWAGIEVLRSWGQVSFPWGHLGYVLGNHINLVQTLSLLGVYGYTVLILFSNLAVVYAIQKKKPWFLLSPVLLLLGLYAHGTWRIDREAEISTETMKISMVQPSISQTNKWTKNYFDSVMAKTWAILDTLNTDSIDLVVLPETAIPDFITLHPKEEFRFKRYARQRNVDVLVGALNYDRNGPPPRGVHYYNSAFYFSPQHKLVEYRKQRLVPFSERLPFDGLIPAINYVDLGEGDFSPGTELPLLSKFAWTPSVCYEVIYPDMVRELVRTGTRMIINITNDGWFGRTTAPGQHANLVRYRSIENGMPVARCANSGISVFYNHLGQNFKNTKLYEVKAIEHHLQLRPTTTLYSKIGDAVEAILAYFALGSLILIMLLKRRKDAPK